jgi:hypothetical protein
MKAIMLGLLLLTACGDKSGAGGGSGNCDPQCSGATPICSAADVCVQCETSEDCPAEAPLCTNNQCGNGCAGTAVAADLVMRPPDIIWVVDQSGSMDQETSYVQQKLNDFVSIIGTSGVDYRVVMIADPNAENAICVPPPLAGPSCGDNTRFRLVPTEVDSNDGPELAVQEYPKYDDFLRPDSLKHIVFVTDDNSDLSATQFTNALLALQPAGMFGNFKVHAIYAYGMAGGNGCTGPFGSGAAEGTVYTELVAATGGASGVICTGNWNQVFMDIQQSVISGSQLACNLDIPMPSSGEAIDPSNVNVRYLPGGMTPGATLYRVVDASACGSSGGWYYNDPVTPTQIVLCPASCTEVQSDAAAKLQVELGCASVIL